MNAIEISGLIKTYSNGVQALKGIDLTVKEGEFYALLGANGAGKTTTIGILTTIVTKTAGDIKVFGYDLDTEINEVKSCIGVVPQEFNINLFEKVWDIVVQQAGYYGIPLKEAEQRAEEILKKLELWDKRNQKSMTLSGGMKRRLMIARALVHKPKLIILDEPTAGVDVELRHGMWKYLMELNKTGTTILLTTHYLEEVEQLCDKAAIIKDGKIIKNDTVRNLTNSLDSETYSITFEPIKTPINSLQGFEITKSTTDTLEVDIKQGQSLNSLIHEIDTKGLHILNLQPKDNKLEKLFLSVLNAK